jgi:hypothetical protein
LLQVNAATRFRFPGAGAHQIALFCFLTHGGPPDG